MSSSSPISAQKNKNRRLIVTFERLTAILHFCGIACHIQFEYDLPKKNFLSSLKPERNFFERLIKILCCLTFNQVEKNSALGDELLEAARLNDSARVHDDNPVTISYRRKSVRHDDSRCF